MKLYNVVPETRTFEWGEMRVVALGERGRARKEVLVPFHAEPGLGAVYEIATTRTGAPKIVSGQPGYGWIALLSSAGVYTRNTYGEVWIAIDRDDDGEEIPPEATVIAHGWGRYGDAGRVGGWEDYLVSIHGEAIFFVVPAGGWKRENYYVIFTRDDAMRVRMDEADAFVDMTGTPLPSPKTPGTWKRLSALTLKEDNHA